MRKCILVKTHPEASLQSRETQYTNLDVAPATIDMVRYALIFSPEKLYRDRAALLVVEKEFDTIIFAQYFCLCELGKHGHFCCSFRPGLCCGHSPHACND
jgi:hypothetical protein